MTGNHWSVFNGAGAVVCDNQPLEVARAYLTPERADRGWNAVYCLVVRDPADFTDGVSASEVPDRAKLLQDAIEALDELASAAQSAAHDLAGAGDRQRAREARAEAEAAIRALADGVSACDGQGCGTTANKVNLKTEK